MKRHYVAAVFLALGLALPVLAAEKATGVGGAGAAAGTNASKESKKTAAKKEPGVEKRAKVAQADKSKADEKGPFKTTRRMRGYGN